MFAYELTRPGADPAYTTSAMKADALATALVNTGQVPARLRIYWGLPDGPHAELAAEYGIPADLDSPGLIARLRRQHEHHLRARLTRGQLPLWEGANAA
jgi:hypothetical protein